jgi:hypothetical protein
MAERGLGMHHGGDLRTTAVSSQGVLPTVGLLAGALQPSAGVGVDLSVLLSLSAGRNARESSWPTVVPHNAMLGTGDLGRGGLAPHVRAALGSLDHGAADGAALGPAHGPAHQMGLQPIQQPLPLSTQHPLQQVVTRPLHLSGHFMPGALAPHAHGLSIPVCAAAAVSGPAQLPGAIRLVDAGIAWPGAAGGEAGGFCINSHRAGHLLSHISSDDTESHNSSEATRTFEASGSSDGSDSGDKKCRAWKIMLTAQQAVQIYKQMPADSLHITSKSVAVGKQYGVSAKTIRDIWKRETWVKATRHIWSEEDERQYREEERKSSAASVAQRPPPGSVASLLSNDEERSPSPHMTSTAPSNSAGPSRSRGRPKGVKDSRPRKRRCMATSAADIPTLLRGTSVTSTSSRARCSSSPAPSRSPTSLEDAPLLWAAVGRPGLASQGLRLED